MDSFKPAPLYKHFTKKVALVLVVLDANGLNLHAHANLLQI